MAGMTMRAPAKINLHLGIYAELDERRYHRADSVMVALDIYDTVEVELGNDGEFSAPLLTCTPDVGVSPENNTVYKAAVALGKLTGHTPAVRINLAKRIPDQAGLGGSSSDAAAVLKCLCTLWGIDKNDERVVEAARMTGADVPFFLDPVPTLLVGAGDVVAEKFPPLTRPLSVVLIRPDGPGVSTPRAYRAFDDEHDDASDVSDLASYLRAGSVSERGIASLLANNLDPVACRMLPRVYEMRSWLLEQKGVLGGQVSGSGSCVFGICENDEVAGRVANDSRKFFGGWAKDAHIV